MKNLLFVVGLISILTACQNELPEQSAPTVIGPPTDTIGYMSRHLLRMYGSCTDPEDHTCTRAEMDYLLVTSGLDDRTRQRINKTIIQRLSGDSLTLESYLEGFLAEYDEYVLSDFEFMDEEPGWFFHAQLKMAMNDPRILTLAHLEHIFTGGAHGNYVTEYWHFNRSTGFPVELTDLISDEQAMALKELGEYYFREGMHLGSNGSLNESYGFSFPDDQFYLPEAFALLPEGLTFIFGTYEIASYADGELSFTIPYSALTDIAKPGSALAKLVDVPPYCSKRNERPNL